MKNIKLTNAFVTDDGVAKVMIFKRIVDIDNVKEFIAISIDGFTKISYMHKSKKQSLREYIKDALSKNMLYHKHPKRNVYAKLIKLKITEE